MFICYIISILWSKYIWLTGQLFVNYGVYNIQHLNEGVLQYNSEYHV